MKNDENALTYGESQQNRKLGISIFVDDLSYSAEIQEDIETLDYDVLSVSRVDSYALEDQCLLGDVVFADIKSRDFGTLAALTKLDASVAKSWSRMIISTTLKSLDSVFDCCGISDPQLLVEPTRAERVIALVSAHTNQQASRVREFSEADRKALLRLTEHIGDIAKKLGPTDSVHDSLSHSSSAFSFSGPKSPEEMGMREKRSLRPPLPDPRLVRRIIAQRQLRSRYFDSDLFADPAWDMLLDLTAARVEHVRVSVSSLCIASGVPPTTALRWISQMIEVGLLEKVQDETDGRRAFIQLTDMAACSVASYFHQLQTEASQFA